MALANYTDLKASVAAYLARSDLTSVIPDFIALAEAKFDRLIDALAMETKNTSFSISAEYVNVPTDFIQARNFYIPATPGVELQYMPPGEMTRAYSSTGKPRFYCVIGSQFRFAPAPDSTYTATLVYSLKVPKMALNATNWLLTAHPDLYLYGSLLEAEAYIANDPRLQVWKQGFEEALAQVNAVTQVGRYGAPMAARPG